VRHLSPVSRAHLVYLYSLSRFFTHCLIYGILCYCYVPVHSTQSNHAHFSAYITDVYCFHALHLPLCISVHLKSGSQPTLTSSTATGQGIMPSAIHTSRLFESSYALCCTLQSYVSANKPLERFTEVYFRNSHGCHCKEFRSTRPSSSRDFRDHLDGPCSLPK